MTRFRFSLFAILVSIVMAFAFDARAATTNTPPDFKEVYDLIRSNLAVATDAELNRAAVDGILDQLSGKVSIVVEGETSVVTDIAPIARANVMDNGIGYIRFNQVGVGSAKAFATEWRSLNRSNRLQGLVMDLRYAAGGDYAAAAATADLFIPERQALLDWGDGVVKSEVKTNAINVPLAVLVNSQTRGAAEALAAVLREAGTGLILGSKTSGTAMIAREFPLRNGQQLRIATSSVKLGDGSTLSTKGVQPDISVSVSPQAEREYFEDAYVVLGATNRTGDSNLTAGGATNLSMRRARLSEAELVRQHREGGTNQEDESVANIPRKPATLVIRDPALARAVDLLKALALVGNPHS